LLGEGDKRDQKGHFSVGRVSAGLKPELEENSALVFSFTGDKVHKWSLLGEEAVSRIECGVLCEWGTKVV
jgi:hypothetical protein